MYKLIAIDLDGTLLNSYGEVSKENIEAIKSARTNRNRSCICIWKNDKLNIKYDRRNRKK